jgi:alkaline phosphatase
MAVVCNGTGHVPKLKPEENAMTLVRTLFLIALTLPGLLAQEGQGVVPMAGQDARQTEELTLTQLENAEKSVQSTKKVARNIILFVGDGMGVSTVTSARIFDGQRKGKSGEEHQLEFEKDAYLALAKVYNSNQQVPDSAGTMTAMVTGQKTKAGVISLNQNALRGEPSMVKGYEIMTFLELAELAGKSTGIISTARLTHATPAACFAHTGDRDWEGDTSMPSRAAELGVKDIAMQLVEFPYGNGLELALGGGRRYFLPKTVADPEDSGATGDRADGRNLTKEWLSKYPQSACV